MANPYRERLRQAQEEAAVAADQAARAAADAERVRAREERVAAEAAAAAEQPPYGFEFVADFDFAAQVMAAVGAATSEVAKTLQNLAIFLKRRSFSANYRQVFSDASQQVAVGAQAAVVEAYHQARRRSYRAGTPVYRADAGRYAGGALLGALQSGEFISVSANGGIRYADVGLMNSAAKQWARLNFGAGSGGIPPRPFAVRGGRGVGVFGSFHLVGEPSAAFVLPGGFWVGSGAESTRPYGRSLGRTDLFFPASQGDALPGPGQMQRPVPGRSIKAENWLDAGVKYFAENLPRAYIQAMNDRIVGPAMRDAANTAHGRRVVANLATTRTSGRPKAQAFPGTRGTKIDLGRV